MIKRFVNFAILTLIYKALIFKNKPINQLFKKCISNKQAYTFYWSIQISTITQPTVIYNIFKIKK